MKSTLTLCRTLAALALVVLATREFAVAAVPSVPRQISFQAKVTDPGGGPVSDGSHSVSFALYTHSSGGSQVWTEVPVNVTTAGGLFTHNLGTLTALPTTLENRDSLWLQITFEGEVQTPRIQLVSSPSAQVADALEVRSPNGNYNAVDTDQSGRITTYDGFTGKPLTRLWGVDYDAGGNEDGVLQLDAVDLDALESDVELTARGGEGQLILRSSSIGATLGAGLPGAGGGLYLDNGSGGIGVYMAGGQTGDNAVVVPTGSISAVEQSNEPGVASYVNEAVVVLTGVTEIIASRTIDAPSAGFVLAIGTCAAGVSHTTGASNSFAAFGVSDDAALFSAAVVGQKLPGSMPTSGDYQFPVTAHGIFPVSAGMHTFYYLADEGPGEWIVGYRQLSLAFFPTAYAAVDPPVPTAVDQGPGDGIKDQGAERAQVAAFDSARLQSELEIARAQVEVTAKRLAKLEALMPKNQQVNGLAKPEN